MKRCKYFTIPQTPADMSRLWETAQPLDRTELPKWAEHADPALYRHIGCARWNGPERPEDYRQELFELHHAGIIVDDGSVQHPVDHFYLMDPALAWFNEAEWAIGIYSGKTPWELAPDPNVINPVIAREHITDVPAAFVADPFILVSQNTWWMFFEVMNYDTGKGDIGLARSDDARRWEYQQIVLTEPFHLSYPYVFEHDGSYFMIPETYQAGAVRLYVAEEFPLRWKFVSELLRAPYFADPSIFQHESHWWMFVDASTDLANDTLRLFHSDALTGPWAEHPMSPIVESDVNIARPAGRVVHHDGKPIRFTQGCRPYYGSNVRAFEITELTRTTYAERELAGRPILGPAGNGWNACGMHHVDAHRAGDCWTASVDGWRSETLLRRPLQELST